MADDGLFHFLKVKLLCLDGLVVEINAIVHQPADNGFQLFSEGFANGCFNIFAPLFIVPRASMHLVLLHVFPVVGGSVVGRQEHQIVAFAYLSIEGIEQTGYVLV